MSHAVKRTHVIAELIQRKLSQLIQQEVRDPRLPKLLTISGVEVTRDLSHAKVFFTAFGVDQNPEILETILNHAASYLRTSLARTLTYRTVPQLHFKYDSSIDDGRRLSRLIDEANASVPFESDDPHDPKDPNDSNDPNHSSN